MKINDYISVIKNHSKPTKFLLSRILMRTYLSKFFIIKLKNYDLRFYPTPFLASLWIDPNYAHTADIFFGDYLRGGDKVIDIGANIGAVTLESATKVGDSGVVYSIEPHPRIYKYLLGNIKLNNLTNIKTYNIALGKENGIAFLSDIKSDDQNSIKNNNKGIKVIIKKLDDLKFNNDHFDLMILDAIGYEKFILEGGRKILSRTKCVHFPVLERFFEKYGYVYSEIFSIFKNAGFDLYKFTKDGIISSISEDYVPQENIPITDLLAIRNLPDFLKRTGYRLNKN